MWGNEYILQGSGDKKLLCGQKQIGSLHIAWGQPTSVHLCNGSGASPLGRLETSSDELHAYGWLKKYLCPYRELTTYFPETLLLAGVCLLVWL